MFPPSSACCLGTRRAGGCGRLFLGAFFLAKQKEDTGCRAAPGAEVVQADNRFYSPTAPRRQRTKKPHHPCKNRSQLHYIYKERGSNPELARIQRYRPLSNATKRAVETTFEIDLNQFPFEYTAILEKQKLISLFSKILFKIIASLCFK